MTLLTSPLAVIAARRNLEAKRPTALTAFERNLAAVQVVIELLAAAIAGRATLSTPFPPYTRERP